MCDGANDHSLWFSTHDSKARKVKGPYEWGDAIWLRLQRHEKPQDERASSDRPAVLLLHGGSANHRTFTIAGGLADWLTLSGLDVWLLDWRGSGLVSACVKNHTTLREKSTLYTFNRAALEDLPAAIAKMREFGVSGPIAAVGHCMGSAVIAEAVACGWTNGEINRIVLLALGLFYEAAIDSRLKSEERVLERLTLDVANVPCIDPRVGDDGEPINPWPEELRTLYAAWPSRLRGHGDIAGQRPSVIHSMCNRLGFMYGMPYHHANLMPGIHDVSSATSTPGQPPAIATLAEHFGGFPLQMYLHAARNLRAGEATNFETGSLDIVSDRARERFQRLDGVTLITGELNRLWHRDSIDRMYEWLSRGSSSALEKIHKHVLPDFAHQDLLWSGSKSSAKVYPLIATGLDVDQYRASVSSASA